MNLCFDTLILEIKFDISILQVNKSEKKEKTHTKHPKFIQSCVPQMKAKLTISSLIKQSKVISKVTALGLQLC